MGIKEIYFMKKLLWIFDICIYRLFYWRWNGKLSESHDLRKLFLNYLNSWEAVYREPAMGIGPPPKLKIPKQRIK